jgi:hypothetical protein
MAKDRKLAFIRQATTCASTPYGIGGVPKRIRAPKPVTLPQAEPRECPWCGRTDAPWSSCLKGGCSMGGDL